MNVLFPNREVGLIQLMNMILVILVVGLFTIDKASGVHMAALVGTAIFATTLIPARLLGLKWLERIEPDLLQLARNGKWLGIWTCLWFVLYAVLAVMLYYGRVFEFKMLFQREMILLTVSILIFAVLVALSNKWSYEHVKRWKQINMLIWLVVPFIFTHLLLAAHVFDDNVGSFWASLTLLSLMALAGVSGAFRVRRDYFAFWRIWLLVLGTLLSGLVVVLYPVIL